MAELDLELLASIASGGLGSWQEDAQGHTVYVKNEDCIGCLRDLQRFFRYDDPETRPAFFAVSKYNFARSDLVPLIVTYPDDYDIVYNALKVATFLTMPSSEPLVTSNRAQQEEHMQAVREAFLAQDALAAVVGMLAEPLGRHPRMNDQDAALVQLVIAFLKNLVAIPAAAGGGGAAGTAGKDAARRIQAGLLDRLFSDNVADLLLLLAQHSRQRPFRSEAPVLVEIFMHLFCGVDPQLLLDAPQLLEAEQRRRREEEAAARAAAEKKRRAARRGAAPNPRAAPVANTAHLPRLPALPALRPLAPRAAMPRQVAQAAPSRHPHSGAVYVRRHTEHSAAVVLRHNPNRSELPRLPAVTDAKKAPAQRRDGGAAGAAAGGLASAGLPLSPELLMRLDGLLRQFLEGAYDLLMTQVFKELQPGLNISRLGEADFMHFVRLATYCTRYVRMREERKLQQKMGEKRAAAGGGAAAPAADAAPPDGNAAQQQGIPAGSSPEQQQQQQQDLQQEGEASQGRQEPGGGDAAAEEASPFAAISATMGWDCFHWVTMLWIMLSNIEGNARQKDHADKNWDLQHASVPLLKEMLLALDLARVAGSAADRRAADRLQRRLLHDDLKESGLLPVLSRLIRGYNFRFQPRSHAVDLVEALHVVLGMLDRLAAAEPGGFRVKAAARQGGGRRRKPAAASPAADAEQTGEGGADGDGGAAAGEGEPGGVNDDGEEGPGGEGGEQAGAAAGSDGESGGDAELAQRVGRSGDPLDEMEDEEAAARRRRATREVAFQAAHRLRQELAHPAIVHFYAWLLQGYRTNSPFTNHALLGLFRRLADPQQLNLEPMLYQLSILRLFEAVLSDVAIRRSPPHADLLAFATRLVRSLFARMMPDLSELRQAAGEVGANLEGRFAAAEGGAGGAAAEGGDADDEADSAEREAARARRRAAAELKARQLAADGLFLELLFWKGPNVADDVRNEYNWRGIVDPAEFQRRGGRRGRRAGLGDDEGSDDGGAGQRFFESHRPRRELFSEEEAALLRVEFEKRNGRKDCLSALVFEFGGRWKKGQISRQLRAMGLERGKFTAAQEERMRELHEEGRGRVDCFEMIAEELAAGFSANQVKRHLRKLGVAAGARGGGATVTLEQESRMRELYDEHAARQDSFRLVAEGLGGDWTARRVKRHLQKLGLVARLGKSRQERQRDAAFDALAADSDDQGSGGGGSPRPSAGSGSSSESDSGSGSGFGSARSELEDGSGSGSDGSGSGGSDGGGAAPAQGKAGRRAAALAKLQAKHKGRAQRRAASPELGGPYSDSDDEEEEGVGDAVAEQQEAAAAHAGASPASSDGASDGEAAGGKAGGSKPPAARKRKRAGASASAAAAARREAAGGATDSDGGGDGSGFESARESDPGSEPEPAAEPIAKLKRRSGASLARGPATGKQPRGKKAQRQRLAGTPGTGKRKAEQPAEGPSSAQKRAALEALRRRRHQAAAPPPALAPATEPLMDTPIDSEQQELEVFENSSPAADENMAPQRGGAPAAAPPAKPAARRIMRAGGGETAVAAAAPAVSGLEDLEDDI